jgi:hypothetical protein
MLSVLEVTTLGGGCRFGLVFFFLAIPFRFRKKIVR